METLRLTIKKDTSGSTYGFYFEDSKGNLEWTGDGYESPSAVIEELNYLKTVLETSLSAPVNIIP